MKLNRIVDKGMARIYVSMIQFVEQNPLKDDSFIREAKENCENGIREKFQKNSLSIVI